MVVAPAIVCRRLFVAIVAVLLPGLTSACGHRGIEATALAARGLTPATSVYVSVPADGRFGTRIYAGSGRATAKLIAEAFAARLDKVELAAQEQSSDAALAEARARGSAYLVVPTILRWEDRASIWSGMADVVELRLAVLDAASGQPADIGVIRRRGDLPAAAQTRPEDILPAPLEAYVARLLGSPSATLQAGRASASQRDHAETGPAH